MGAYFLFALNATVNCHVCHVELSIVDIAQEIQYLVVERIIYAAFTGFCRSVTMNAMGKGILRILPSFPFRIRSG